MQNTNQQRQVQIRFHQGQALLNLANTYPTLQDVILELVQNALDEKSTRIWVRIDYQRRQVRVRDNGEGASIEKFNTALSTVAQPNRKSKDKLGQFGIGLVSALGKCKKFVFTSCPAPYDSLYQEWTMETESIVAQKDVINIPTRSRDDLAFQKKVPKKNNVEWRSEMLIDSFDKDQYISKVTLDGLVSAVQDRYAPAMRRNKVAISFFIMDENGKREERNNVTASEYSGRKLDERELIDPNDQKVVFRLYIARKTAKGRAGKVVMGVLGNDFRFPFHIFARTATKIIGAETVNALNSGIFEGEILAEKATLHANRSTFVDNDFRVGLCIIVENWFEQYGKAFLDEARQSRQEERHQELGLRSMKVLEGLLQDPVHSSLLKVIKSFGRGSVGVGHANVPGKQGLGDQVEKTLSVVDGNVGEPRDKRGEEEEPRNRQKPIEHKPDHMPLTVAGPKGQRRKEVRGHSTGLGFTYDAMEGSADLWKLDLENGVLRFNIRHPLWMACDDYSDLALMRLQECVAIQALTLQLMPETFRLCQRQAFDEFNGSLVSWILSGDKARGTIPNSKKKSSKTDQSS